MPDIVMSGNMEADAKTGRRAITTFEGVTGWFTAKAHFGDGVGAHHLLTYPEMPASWVIRIEDEIPTGASGRRFLSVLRHGTPPP
jgi:hypothetical protein